MRLAGVFAVCAVALTTATPQVEAKPDPALVQGARYFDQAISYVRNGKQGVKSVARFHCHLHDVKLDDGGRKNEGHLRLWLDSEDKFRQEWRHIKDPAMSREMETPSTKILNGNQGWVVTKGKTTRLHGKSGGAEAVAQLQDDRRRLADLANLFTLEGLKGPKVTFRFEGRAERKTGAFAGSWLVVRRKAPDEADMVLHLAHETDAEGGIRATFPGVVTILGSEATRERTEWYVLKRWKTGAQSRFPGEIAAYALPPEKKQHTLFFYAWPHRVEFNKALDETLFLPPKKK